MADIDPVVPFLMGMVFDCAEPATLAEWWATLLDTEVVHETDDFCVVRPSEGRKTTFSFQKVPEAKQVKNRVHPDLVVGDMEAAAVRAEELGATRLATNTYPGGWAWIVMQDPEGNEFDLVQPPPSEDDGDH